MLNRIDHDSPIRTEAEFDQALLQCFRAKNSMANVHGYSPEQAVLGKMSKLPGSLTSDQDLESHQLASEDHPAARRFQEHLNLRTRARQAFLEADNASALRRAVLRKSRRDIQPWQVGQLCMYWDKHRAPNMIEKGRWCGPAQVVLHESRSIVWITHLNRLLRCARENLRPVSMREFSRRPQATALENDERIAQMARQLERNLRERVGMFQFHDLSDPVAPPPEVEEQPEEEPRRTSETSTESRSIGIQDPSEAEVEAHEIPVPETPKEAHEVPVPDHGSDLDINDQESVREPNDVGEVDEGESSNGVATVSHTGVVYNAEMIEGCGGPVCFWGDESGLWDPHFAANNQGMVDESVFTLELEMPMQRFHRYCKDPVLHEAYIVDAAKKAKSEVQFSSLNSEDKERFRQAKAKELRCWIETSAVEKIMRHIEQIMTSRWILTWKPDESHPSGRKAKARLVVRGFQDPDLDTVQTDSPTLTRDGRMVLLQAVSSKGWEVQSFDITTAFLRGRSDGRELAMDPVPEFREILKLHPDEVCLLKGNAYGRVDAPLLFYKEFRKQLEAVGFVAHPLDNCLYLLRDPRDPKKLDGILGTHVDDGIGGGNQRFEAALDKLQQKLPFGSRERRRFVFTGLLIEQLPDNSIRVSQEDYVHKIEPIDVIKGRRSDLNAAATPTEKRALRAVGGSLQYAAVNSRPDIATRVASIMKSTKDPRVRDLLEANKFLNEAKQHAATSVVVRPIPEADLTFASFGDASFASEAQLSAQQGMFIMACTDSLARNQTTEFSPLSWSSKQISRVVRSTLSAEAYSMSRSLDKLNWIRIMWGIILDAQFQWRQPEVSLKTMRKALKEFV